ncbi:MAG: hypothetical protein A3E87_03805 [Gammaproteobacteria bacterium RIFCSPHIGHO2_12_FULL_35_23]|nr:MAG: hypothetical protein A3E87_03805 [Gammaproteobacteria bacterium RIFCSPHIGHO2_12_FULL_35_23]
MKIISKKSILSVLLTLIPALSFCANFLLPVQGDDVVGQPQVVQVGMNNYVSLMEQYDVGYYELVEANPGSNIEQLRSSDNIVVPTSFILPNVDRQGIVINIAEMRMYFYPAGQNIVLTYPVGIGKSGWNTPIGKTQIVDKMPDPQWQPTPAVRADFLNKYGYPLPQYVMPGPDNPLGPYAIRLAWLTYLIHGTNNPAGVGQRSSAGCIRMLNPDVTQLYSMINVGTPVHVVYQPCKAGWQGNVLYLEAHLPVSGYKGQSYKTVIKTAMKERTGTIKIDWKKANQIAKLGLGIPEEVGTVVTSNS